MKCHNCGSKDMEKLECFPGRAHVGWTVYYCTNKGCNLAGHTVPQVPRRKPVDSIEVNSAKPSPVKMAEAKAAAA